MPTTHLAKANLETLHWLSLKRSVRRAWGRQTAARAASLKHTDWTHEQEIRLLAPKSGALFVLADVLKRIHYVRRDGDHWPGMVRLLAALYPAVELVHWQFNHGALGTIQTPMEIRLVPI